MTWRGWGCLALLISTPAWAAEITDVADAADVRQVGTQAVADAWDLRIMSTWESTWVSGIIAREYVDGPNAPSSGCSEKNSRACGPADSLSYTRQSLVQLLQIEAGLYHDLSLTLELPVVYNDTLKFSYANGVTAATSNVDTGNADISYFAHDFASYHQGLGALGLGVRWGLLNDERDLSKAAWVASFKWYNPATTHTNRFAPTTGGDPGNVGDGMHRLVIGTAFSKRVASLGDIGVDEALPRRGYLEPYIEMSYSYPIAASGRALTSLLGTGDFASSTAQIGRLRAGMEFVAHEDLASGTKFALDLGMRGAYFSEARDYTVLSEPLMRATWSEQVLNITGYFGMVAQPIRYFKIKLGGAVGYDTEHWLTNEIFATETAASALELNPNYCGNDPTDVCSEKNLPSVDAVGLRFRERARLSLSASLSLHLLF